MGSTVGDGRLIVAAAGTRKKLSEAAAVSSPTGPIRSVCVQALENNTGKVVVGGPAVVAALATRRGVALSPLGVITIPTDDLADVSVDVMVSGEGVTFTWVA